MNARWIQIFWGGGREGGGGGEGEGYNPLSPIHPMHGKILEQSINNNNMLS